MKAILFFTIPFFVALSAYGSIPSVEGLFRGGDNPDIAGDTIAVNVFISETQPSTSDQQVVQTVVEGDQETLIKVKESFFKLIFSVTPGRPIGLIQVRYSAAGLETNQVAQVKYIENLEKSFAQEPSFNRLLAYALITMHSLNKSSGFDELLKRFARDYKSNAELLNQDKKRLYTKYKEHLASKSEELSPLEPESDEEKERVNEILGSRFYDNTGKAKLIRTNNEFLWEVNLDTLKAYFNHDDRLLKKIVMTNFNGEVQVDVGPYFKATGDFKLPSFVLVKHSTGEEAKITFSGYQDFNSGNKRFLDRAEDYEKFTQKNISSQLVNKEQLHVVEYMY